MRRLLFCFVFVLVSCQTVKTSCPLDPVLETVRMEEIEGSLFNSYRSYLYMPSEKPKGPSPVLVFLHGYFDATPRPYDALLRYLASQGYVVVYPTYGNMLMTSNWTDNAFEAVARAFQNLSERGITVDKNRIGIIGHSVGGLLAFHMSARSPDAIHPRIIVGLDTAGIATPAKNNIDISDLQKIPADTELVLLMAEKSFQARLKETDHCANDAKDDFPRNCNVFAANARVFQRSPQVRNKNAFLVKGDHNAVQSDCDSGKPLDDLDIEGYWKPLKITLDRSLQNPVGSRTSNLQLPSINECLLRGHCSDQVPN